MTREHPYAQAAKQLNKLIRLGHSFSGRERNCCFLNIDGHDFANVSAVSGLNYADDGRAVVRCDWDRDGDLDFWVANRTGPQIRFLRNELTAHNHFLAFTLVGTDSNRDAIGAQVRIELENGSVLRQGVRAGEGFLGQSSKVAHFGLGMNQNVRRLEVRWPNGRREIFPVPTTDDGHYRLVEGSGHIEQDGFTEPAFSTVKSDFEVAAADAMSCRESATAHLLNQSFPLPRLEFTLLNGEAGNAATPSGHPLLVNLWATWCQPCLKELDEWSHMAHELREHDVEVVALSVDDAETHSTSAESKAFLDKIQFPFRSGIATPQLLEILQLVNNAVYKDDHRPLPVPASFLIDGDGRLAAIYKGPVSVDVLLRHVKSLTLSAEKRAIASLPFPGRWLGKPGPHALTKLNARLWDYGFEEIAAEFASGLGDTEYRAEKAKLLLANAIRFRERGDTGAAKQQLDRLLELDPHDPGAMLEIGTNLAKQGDLAAAVEKLTAAVAGFKPPRADAHLNLGAALRRLNRPQEALQHLRRALELEPDFAEAHASLGMLMASTGDYQKAAESFGKATRLDGNDVEYRINLAVAWMHLDRLNDALEQLRQAVRIRPASAVAHTYLSEVLGQLGRFDEACSELKTALELDPSATKLWFRLGELAEHQGDIATALDSFQRALELAPNQPALATRIAWILATVPDDSLRNGAQAVRLAEAAAKATQRKIPPVLDVLAAAYAEDNRFDEAIATAEEAVSLLREDSESPSPLIGQIGTRLEGYRNKRKFRNEIRGD